jgi:chaperonin GroEL (HSP60 family)
MDRKVEFPGEEQLGINLIKRALEEAVRQIADNAGFEGSKVVQHVMKSKGSRLKRFLVAVIFIFHHVMKKEVYYDTKCMQFFFVYRFGVFHYGQPAAMSSL